MKIVAVLVTLSLLVYGGINLILKTSAAPQETPLTIKEVTAFERNSGKPYIIIRNRDLQLKLRYEVERILEQWKP